MRILVARCEIAYHGRAVTRLGAGDRTILFKDDGSLCVHADKGFKPLNYMAGPTTLREEGDTIRVYRPASDETLVILVHEVLSHTTPGTNKAGAPSKATYRLADGVADRVQARAQEMLDKNPLYPGLELT